MIHENYEIILFTKLKIKELYVLAVEARHSGQDKIPVHIFPTKLSDVSLQTLKQEFDNAATQSFWNNLKTMYDDFEKTKKLKTVHITAAGRYSF